MSAKVYYRAGKYKYVKNLGWLLKYGRLATLVRVSDATAHNNHYGTDYDCIMAVYFDNKLTDIQCFECGWADRTILKEWIHRPIFRDLPLTWFGKETKC